MLDAMQLHRAARFLHLRRVPLAPTVLRKLIQYLHGSYLPPEAEIGEGTELGYGGLGVVVHAQARVGRNCFLSPQVTLGGRSQLPGAPVLEDGVIVGSGAKILGPIRIGAGAKIGANAVVISNVRPGATVAGVPARELRPSPGASRLPSPSGEGGLEREPDPVRRRAVDPLPSPSGEGGLEREPDPVRRRAVDPLPSPFGEGTGEGSA